jgi:hypothetical protein
MPALTSSAKRITASTIGGTGSRRDIDDSRLERIEATNTSVWSARWASSTETSRNYSYWLSSYAGKSRSRMGALEKATKLRFVPVSQSAASDPGFREN